MGYNPKKDHQLRNQKSYESGLGRNQFKLKKWIISKTCTHRPSLYPKG